MDDDAKLRLLEEQAPEVYMRLRRYIGRMTSARGLPSGYGNADEIIHEAIRRFLGGTRRWKPEELPLIPYLTGIVRSMLSEKKGLYQRERSKPLGNVAAGVEPLPEVYESTLLSPEEANERWEAVKSIVKDDSEALTYIEAIRLGLKPDEISAETGIPIERVYEIPRKLKKLGPIIDEALRRTSGTTTRL